MKVLMVNGSAKPNGCTMAAFGEIERILKEEGIEVEYFQIGGGAVRDCIGCAACRKNGSGKCVFDDDVVNRLIDRAKEADGFVFGTPVYYAHPSGRILSVLDRAFYAGGKAFQAKPAAAIASARRAGTTASVDVLNKYLMIARMPIVSSTYWNMVHGNTPEEVMQDAEGLQVMRGIGHNMAWLLKCIAAGKAAGVVAPEPEVQIRTNFIR